MAKSVGKKEKAEVKARLEPGDNVQLNYNNYRQEVKSPNLVDFLKKRYGFWDVALTCIARVIGLHFKKASVAILSGGVLSEDQATKVHEILSTEFTNQVSNHGWIPEPLVNFKGPNNIDFLSADWKNVN